MATRIRGESGSEQMSSEQEFSKRRVEFLENLRLVDQEVKSGNRSKRELENFLYYIWGKTKPLMDQMLQLATASLRNQTEFEILARQWSNFNEQFRAVEKEARREEPIMRKRRLQQPPAHD